MSRLGAGAGSCRRRLDAPPDIPPAQVWPTKFQFRLKDPGTETVIAICNASGIEAGGIKHDFATRQFTPLGNYREFLTRQIVVEGAGKIAAAQSDQQGGSGGPGPGTAKPNILSRTAIKLTVK